MTKKGAASSADIADDEVLAPDRELTVGGKPVVVRALTLTEGVRARPIAAAFVDDLVAQSSGDDVDGIIDLIENHADALIELTAIATGEPVAWLRGLPYGDGITLLVTLWEVNRGFFLTRVIWEHHLAQARRSVSSTSSIPSSPPDTVSTRETSPDA